MSEPLRAGDPARLDRYRLLSRLGAGGQGVVYLAEAPDGRQVAVKLLAADALSNERARSRFMREVELAKQVARFCTAQVIEAGVAGGRPYLVGEYVAGPSLQELVVRGGPMSGAGLDRLAVATATALAAIHQAGVVHRDFKPANVLIGADGPRVIDFGIARALDDTATMTSSVIGTPAYMTPEQLAGEPAGYAADVFAWGATMCFAANATPPFGTDTVAVVMNRILNEPPDLGRLTEPLRGLVAGCLAKDPAQRPSARELLMGLIESAPTAAEEAAPTGVAARLTEPPPPVPLTDPTGEPLTPALPGTAEHSPTTEARTGLTQVVGVLKSHNRGAILLAVVSVLVLGGIAFAILWWTGDRDRGGPGDGQAGTDGTVDVGSTADPPSTDDSDGGDEAEGDDGQGDTGEAAGSGGGDEGSDGEWVDMPAGIDLPGTEARLVADQTPDEQTGRRNPAILASYDGADGTTYVWDAYEYEFSELPHDGTVSHHHVALTPDLRFAAAIPIGHGGDGDVIVADRQNGDIRIIELPDDRPALAVEWNEHELLVNVGHEGAEPAQDADPAGFTIVDLIDRQRERFEVAAGDLVHLPLPDGLRFRWVNGGPLATIMGQGGRTEIASSVPEDDRYGVRFYDREGTQTREAPGAGRIPDPRGLPFTWGGGTYLTHCAGVEGDDLACELDHRGDVRNTIQLGYEYEPGADNVLALGQSTNDVLAWSSDASPSGLGVVSVGGRGDPDVVATNVEATFHPTFVTHNP